jgi:hypothetical protein
MVLCGTNEFEKAEIRIDGCDMSDENVEGPVACSRFESKNKFESTPPALWVPYGQKIREEKEKSVGVARLSICVT